MANVKVRMFGVIRLGAGLKATECNASSIDEVFAHVNKISPKDADDFSFDDAIVFINGDRVSTRKYELKDGDEVWLMSPASGG